MSTRALLAVLAGAVFLFLFGWLVYGILLMDFYTTNAIHYEGLMKEMPNLFWIFVSHLAWAFLYTYIFDRWAKISTFMEGFKAGLIIGLPLMILWDLYFLASMNLFNTTAIVVDIIVGTITSGLLGGVLGWVLGSKKAAA
jgi:hypothetical protein